MLYLCSQSALARRLTALSRPCASFLLLSKFALCCLAVFLTSRASAQSVWSTTTGNWNTGSNWSPTSVPLNKNTTALVFGGAADYTSTNDIGTFTLSQLLFTNTAGTITLAGSSLDFDNSDRAVLSAITLSNAGSATISAPVIWDGETTVTNSGSGTLLFSGNQTFATGTKQTFINSGTGTITLADGVTYATSGTNTGLVLKLINNNAASSSFNIGNVTALANTTFTIGGTGTVSFNGTSATSLFSSTAVLNVLSGATFDLNGSPALLGTFSGAGTIAIAGVNLNASAVGSSTFSGKLTGVGGSLTVSGATQSLTLSGSTSDYTGVTTINAGRLIISANAPSGSAGALGNATSEVLVGNTTGSSLASLLIDTAGVNIGRNVRLQTGNTGTATVGGLNTSGTVTYSGNITMGTNSAAGKALTIFATAGGTVEFTGNLLRATSASGTSDSLTVTGGGTVALRGGNTFTGGTAVNSGLLLLDFSTNNSSKLSTTASLNLMTGGSLSLVGSNINSTSQTVGSVNFGNTSGVLGGSTSISVTSGTNQNATLVLKAIARRTGATMDFSTTNTGTGVANITTTTGNNAANIIGVFATYKLNDWAVNDGAGNIVGLDAGFYSTSFGSGMNTSVSDSTILLDSGGATTYSLRLTGSTAITFSSGSDSLYLESGGILVASYAGATSIGATGSLGILTTPASELIIQQQSIFGALTINSIIGGTSGLTKSGDGTLVLTASNTYTGNTIINGGTLAVTTAANLGALTNSLTINGGTLSVTGGNIGTVASDARTVIVGPEGATFNFVSNVGFSGNGFSGTGTVTKTGVGVWSVGANGSSFSGNIIINDGSLLMTSSQLKSVAGITINNGGTFNINDDGTGTWNIAAGARFILNGNGLASNGAIRVTDQAQYVTAPGASDPVATITNDVVLQTTSRIQTENGSVAGSLSQLILSGIVSGAGGIDKTGNGVLALSSRDNSYTGSTLVENGTLRIDLGNDRLPTGTTVTLGTGATSGVLQLNGFSQTIAGLTTSGSGTANSVIGGSTTSVSLLDLNIASGTQTYSGTVGGVGASSNAANNNLGVIKDGAGTMVLSGANTYSGATSVNQGTLMLGNAKALGGGTSLDSGTAGTTVSAGATLDLNGQANVQEVITLNGTGVSGAGALVNNSATAASIGSGIASLSVSSSTTTGWTGSATVTISAPGGGGTRATATAQLGLSNSSITITAGGSNFSTTSSSTAAVITVTGGGGSGAVVAPVYGITSASFNITSNTTTYSVAPTVTLTNGATGVAVLTSGKVTGITITNPGSGFTGAPTATFSGGVVSSQGTNPTAAGVATKFTVVGVNVTNPGTGYTSAPTIVITGGTGATATANNTNFVLNGIAIGNSGSGYTSAPTVTVSGGSATATANLTTVNLASDSSVGGSGDLTINAVVTGNAGLTKVGAGTTTLAANNTYTGTTTVSAGTLQVGASGSGQSGAGTLTVNGAGAVLAGTGTVQGDTVVTLGVIKPGDNAGAGTGMLTTHNLSFTPASSATVMELQITGSSALGTLGSDKINIVGSLTLSSLGNILVNGTGYTAKVGDTFTLLDWSGLLTTNGFSTGTNLRTGANGAGNEGNLDLPDITGIGAWQISTLLNGGDLTLTIVAVPEPARGLLLLLGCMTLVFRRRRK